MGERRPLDPRGDGFTPERLIEEVLTPKDDRIVIVVTMVSQMGVVEYEYSLN